MLQIRRLAQPPASIPAPRVGHHGSAQGGRKRHDDERTGFRPQSQKGGDGTTIFIVDTSGKAHTITTPANKIIGNKHSCTFNGTIGSNITLRAMSGLWVVKSTSGVTVT